MSRLKFECAGIRLVAIMLAAAAAFLSARPVEAQSARLTIDPKLSLAWWQVNPHLNHLWATTCPGDPSWRAGEGTSMAQAKSIMVNMQKRRAYSAIMDTIVPLYPRRRARPVCADAVSGTIEVSDTVAWRGVRGSVVVDPDALTTGLKMRDDFARNSILQTQKYQTITFRIDSLVSVQRGDTLRAIAAGQLDLHGVKEPMRIPVRAWREAGGLRVTGQADLQARDMETKFNISKWALGLGVGSAIWQVLHIGIDVVLKPEGTRATNQ
jgi:polyisoprenoid-binding protein YceI